MGWVSYLFLIASSGNNRLPKTSSFEFYAFTHNSCFWR